MPRIITLYLIGQITKIIFLTLIVLFSVFFLNEFTVYLERVSSGELYPELLILVSIYSMSEIVEVVMPLSVFIGTIIAIYRLDQNNELLAFAKMGLGKRKIVLLSSLPAIFFAVFVAVVSFYLTPLSNNKLAFLNDVERFSDRFKLMGAEKINVLDDLNAIFYAKKASDRGFQNVFSSFETKESEFVLTADELISKPLNDKENRISFESGKFSILSEAMPLDFSFEEFFLILPKKPILNVEDLKRKYFHELIFAEDLERIELLKRSSMPLIIIISALIAASLTMRLKDSGRFYIFLSGMIIFMSYYGLSLSQEVFGNFFLNSTVVFFSIHGIYLSAAILLAMDQNYQNFSFNLGGLKYSRNFMVNLFVLFLIATIFSYLVFYVFL